jgi:hypothetical protein
MGINIGTEYTAPQIQVLFLLFEVLTYIYLQILSWIIIIFSLFPYPFRIFTSLPSFSGIYFLPLARTFIIPSSPLHFSSPSSQNISLLYILLYLHPLPIFTYFCPLILLSHRIYMFLLSTFVALFQQRRQMLGFIPVSKQRYEVLWIPLQS